MTPPSDDDIGALGRSVSASELGTLLERSLRRLGFESFDYHWFARHREAVVLYSLRGERPGQSGRRLWLDPFVQHCRIAYTPVVWQSLAPDASIRHVLTWSPWKGLPIRAQSGIAVPVHGPDGGFGLLNATVAVDRPGVVPPENVHAVHARALVVYETVFANRDNPRFGMAREVVETQETALFPYVTVEKSRVLPAAKH